MIMQKLEGRKIMKRIYTNFVFDVIMAIIFLALGIVMLPPLNIGPKAMNILFAVLLVTYLVSFLYDKIKRTRGSILILSCIEFIVVSIVAVEQILQQFSLFNLSGACETFGFVIALRGIISVVEMYILASTSKRAKYSLPAFMAYLLLVCAGVFVMARPFISDLIINWILCGVFFLLTLIFTGFAFLYAPTKKNGK